MELSQQKFISEKLDEYSLCEIQEKYIGKIKEISISTVSNILSKKFVNGSDMKAVLCLFDTLILATKTKKIRDRGLYNLNTNINEWITKMEKLPIKSVEGFVYITDIFSKDIQIVIKVPQDIISNNSMIREYFMGIKAINNLRYLIPNFVYTLGAFICHKPIKTGEVCAGKKDRTPFVLYEKIPGDSVANLLKSNKITFEQWLLIFVQLLLALDVAQRDIRFTHFDLHAGNVMVRKEKNFNYSIPIDNKSYHINNPGIIPVVIDFGLASAYIDNRYIGSFDFPEYGMLNFIVSGYDMYKFMIYSCSFASSNTVQNKIMDLFRFYGNNDPYNIVKDRDKGITEAKKLFCKETSYSFVATYTPLMLVEWIWSNYRTYLQPFITISKRIQYLPVKYSSTIKEYDNIFNHGIKGREHAIELANNCTSIHSSYIMTKYNVTVLEKYNKGLQSPELSLRIKGINAYLNSSGNLMTVDLARLEKVFDIPIPSQDRLTSIVNNLLNITIRNSNPKNKQKAVSDLDIMIYQEQLAPYLQFYYTILELNLESEFDEWIQRFEASNIYFFYTKNVVQNERAIRWGQTLLASII